jgi:ATP-binding cassette, subfamily B, bacterial HlyB/CyaB
MATLSTVARFHQVAADPATLAHQLDLSGSDSLRIDDLLRAGQHLGLKAKLSRSTPERLALTHLPALALMHSEDDSLRVVVLAQSDGQRVMIQDGTGRPTIEPVEVFTSQWTGQLILINSRASLAGELAKFDFSWFIPALVKYRKLLGEVLLISFMLQLFGLVSPLFFQLVMDKVLVHKGMTKLDVLVIGLVILVIFEGVVNDLRAYVFSPTTSRINVELSVRLSVHTQPDRLVNIMTNPVTPLVDRVNSTFDSAGSDHIVNGGANHAVFSNCGGTYTITHQMT